MKKIVFSGGTHCGKTTIVEHFSELGYVTVPETAMVLMPELSKKMGLEEYRNWRSQNQQQFFDMLVDRHIESELSVQANKNETVLFDRGLIDIIVMCKYVGVRVPKKAEDYLKDNLYDKIYICDILPNFDERRDTPRVFTKLDSEKIHQLVKEEYKKRGYKFVVLPAVSFEERLKLIQL